MKKNLLLLIIALIASLSSFCQETYKVGDTEYYYNQYYSTTGKPLVKRSESNKHEYLKSLGYDYIPEGYEIDHIKPLSEGGSDDPSNMQLITIEQHKRKTARERSNRANSTSTSTRDYSTTTTFNNLYNNQNNNSTYTRTDSNGRTIYIGSRGGEYYLNSSGKKVYVKSESTSTTRSNYSSPTYSPSRSSSTRTIQTGPRGRKYYINSNGNKTYVKRKN